MGGGISTQKVFIVNFSLLNGHFYQKIWAKCMKNEVVVVVVAVVVGGDKSKKNYCAFLSKFGTLNANLICIRP